MKLTLVVPVYLTDSLHQEFTLETIDSVNSSHPINTLVVVNHASPSFAPFLDEVNTRKSTQVLHNPRGNILGAAWNQGILSGLESGSDYVLLANNDIVFHPKCIDNLVRFAQSHPDYLLWTASEWSNLRTLKQATWDDSHSPHPHFSCFMVNKQTVDTVGWFDENLKVGYFEDNDFHIRILIAGREAHATNTAKFYHYGSRTINVDDNLRQTIKPAYEKNRTYIKKKWGLDIHGKAYSPPEKILDEIYHHPFNDVKKSLKDW